MIIVNKRFLVSFVMVLFGSSSYALSCSNGHLICQANCAAAALANPLDLSASTRQWACGNQCERELNSCEAAERAEEQEYRRRRDDDYSKSSEGRAYIDPDSNIGKLDRSGNANAAPPQVGDPAQEAKDFENALILLKGGEYNKAALAFNCFTKFWPNSKFLPAAYFWSGMSWLQVKDFKMAIELFGKMASTWPEDARAPDALLSMASAQEKLRDTKAAKKTLETLVAKYPKSEAAKIAAQHLAKK